MFILWELIAFAMTFILMAEGQSCPIQCEQISASACQGLSYSMTGFPSLIAQSQQDPSFAQLPMLITTLTSCYPDSKAFLCGVWAPECVANTGLIYPSTSMCEAFMSGCSSLLQSAPISIDCGNAVFVNSPTPQCSITPTLPAIPTPLAVTNSEDATNTGTTSMSTTCSFRCEPIGIPECMGLTYVTTGFPNVYNHTTQKQVEELAVYISIAESFNCYPESTTFLCGTALPECRVNEGLVYPSRQMCEEFLAGCGSVIASIPDAQGFQFNCTVFAETPGPVCYDQPPMTTTMSTTPTESTRSGNQQTTKKQEDCSNDLECSAISISCGPQTLMVLITGFMLSMIYRI